MGAQRVPLRGVIAPKATAIFLGAIEHVFVGFGAGSITMTSDFDRIVDLTEVSSTADQTH